MGEGSEASSTQKNVDRAKGNANIGNNENLLVYFELRAITKKTTLPNFQWFYKGL
jgi:hypothetical protein